MTSVLDCVTGRGSEREKDGGLVPAGIATAIVNPLG